MSTYSKLKKNISISLVFVGLSVIGFFILQASWVYNTKESQSHRILEDVGRAASEVAEQLAKQKNVQNGLARPVMPPGLRLPNTGFELTLPSLVADHFTFDEVNEKFQNALKKHDAGHINIEYAIFNGSRFMEMNTPNYTQAALQTSRDTLIPSMYVPIPGSVDMSIGNTEAISVIIPNFSKQVWKSLTWSLVSFALFTLIILTAFYLTVRNMLEQGKLSQTKTDFINNMTHEFKTPIATVSLAVDALQNPKVIGNEEKMAYFSGIIKEENKRMNKHVETILQAATMEKQELNIHYVPLHVHEIIQHIVDSFSLQLESKGGKIEEHLKAENDVIYADETHFTNLINNLVDNAVKYSKPDVPPVVKILTSSGSKGVTIKVMDNGIGMSKDTIKHVFDRFYRAHTGNVHNVKGFGLGMSYVKQIVEAHHGRIKVDSSIGKGSLFTVDIPYNQQHAEKSEA